MSPRTSSRTAPEAGRGRPSRLAWLLVVPLLVLAPLWWTGAKEDPARELLAIPGTDRPSLAVEPTGERERVGAFVRALLAGEPSPSEAGVLAAGPGLVRVAAWGNGKELRAAWGEGESNARALERAMGTLAEAGQGAEPVEWWMVELIRARRPFGPGDREVVERADARGEWGLAIEDRRWSPGQLLGSNRSIIGVLDRRAEAASTTRDRAWSSLRGEVLESDLVLVSPKERAATLLVRGEASSDPARLGAGARDWLTAQGARKSLPYLQLPWLGRDSRLDHAEREWMAVWLLCRAGERGSAARFLPALERRTVERRGARSLVIDEQERAGLGAQALAALAIACVRGDDDPVAGRLGAEVDALQEDGGALRTFAIPEDGVGWQRTWPGMAAVWWSTRAAAGDEAASARLDAAIAYYRAWRAEDRNRHQASVPWWLLAAVARAREGDAAAAGLVRELVGETLDRQARGDARAVEDLRGRFHDPTRPQESSGVSSETAATAVALGEAAAWLASEGDRELAERARSARARALEHLARLQLDAGPELFAIPRRYRSRVVGGVRQAPGDLRVRSDVMGWVLMATSAEGP